MQKLFENWRKYLNEVNPGAQALKNRIRKHQNLDLERVRSGEEVEKSLGYGETNDGDHLSDEAEIAIHPEADVVPEKGDSQKLLDVFWGNGAQALQLAEMTGNKELAGYFSEIIEMVREYISRLDGYISGNTAFDRKLHLTGNSIEDDAYKIANRARQIKVRFAPGTETPQFDYWIDMMVEAGDYIWYHGTPSPSLNTASEVRAKSEYEDLKSWAGA